MKRFTAAEWAKVSKDFKGEFKPSPLTLDRIAKGELPECILGHKTWMPPLSLTKDNRTQLWTEGAHFSIEGRDEYNHNPYAKQTADTLTKVLQLLPKELPDEIPESEVPKCKCESDAEVMARIKAERKTDQALRVKKVADENGYCYELYKGLDNGRLYARQRSGAKGNRFWCWCSFSGEPDTPLKRGLQIHIYEADKLTRAVELEWSEWWNSSIEKEIQIAEEKEG